jgi:hypothetical protein
MKRFFQKFILRIYLSIHSFLIKVGIAMVNTDYEILKANPDDLAEKDKRTTRKLHRSNLLEKFYAGQRDEKYVQDYYEILKKADKFIRTATPHKVAVTADKHRLNYGMKDQYGRRYEHYGFFDDKHKHAGKTIGEVIELEFEERRTKDDSYELLYIFDNTPIEVGFSKAFDVLKKIDEKKDEKTDDVHEVFEVLDIATKSKTFEFPIKVSRNEEVANKIEQLAEYVHVKKIGFEYRQLEFFIPLKFKTDEIEENSQIFLELTNFNSIFAKNEYGELMGFGIIGFKKRIKHNNTFEVWKFEGIEMENVRII